MKLFYSLHKLPLIFGNVKFQTPNTKFQTPNMIKPINCQFMLEEKKNCIHLLLEQNIILKHTGNNIFYRADWPSNGCLRPVCAQQEAILSI